MSYRLTIFQLPSGAPCARVEWETTMTGEDASVLVAETEPGGKMHGLPFLALGQKLRTVTPEARKVFSGDRAASFKNKVALVMPNPVIRVTINFIMRVNHNQRQRVFANVEEAIRWLDEGVRQDGGLTL
jgi:hypothetical protein